MKHYIQKLIIGFIIGLGGVLPGVSGGVMAVSFGVYEGMIQAVSGFFRAPKTHIRYLLPLVIGGGLGALAVTLALQSLYDAYEPQIISLFMGMVLGCVPDLIRGCGKQKITFCGVLTGMLCLGLILGISYLGSLVPSLQNTRSLNLFTGGVCGLTLAIGVILPGISASFVLIFLGLYQPMLDTVKALLQLDVTTIVPLLGLGITFATVALLLIRCMSNLLARHPGPAAFSMLGFTLGSVVLVVIELLPRMNWVCLPLALLGVALGLLQSKLSEEKEKRA